MPPPESALRVQADGWSARAIVVNDTPGLTRSRRVIAAP